MYENIPSEAVVGETHVRIPRHFLSTEELPQPVKQEEREYEAHSFSAKTELRAAQLDPFLSMAHHRGGITALGCGHGKTVIGLIYAAARGLKTCVVFGQIPLGKQWLDEAKKHLNIEDNDIGWVQGKKWQWENCGLVLASISTLTSRVKAGTVPEGFFESFGLVLFDECHHLAAPEFARIAPLFYGERHGLSATPHREDGLEALYINHLGPIHYKDIGQELIPYTTFIRTSYELDDDADVYDALGELHHRKLCAWLGTIPTRNELILQLIRDALEAGHHILCTTHSVEHAHHMHKLFPESGVSTGSIDAEDRKPAIANNRVSFATLDTTAEALDVPTLSTVIVMTPFGAKAHGNVLQQLMGRMQRKHKDKVTDTQAIFINDAHIPMCAPLNRQIKRCLKKWNYPFTDKEA